MPATTQARPTLAQIRRWPPTVSVRTAAPTLGMSARALYTAIASGRCPVRTITVNGRLHIVTASLVGVLAGQTDDSAR